MDLFTMIAVIVIAAILGEMFKAHKKSKNEGYQPEVERLESEVQALKERVKTLETLVTDKTYQLRNEIDGLRDR